MGTRDRVRLSVQERRQLATLEAIVQARDPELATVLTASLRPWERLRCWARARLGGLRWSLVAPAVGAAGKALGRAGCWAVARLPGRLRRVCLRARWLGPVFGTISLAVWVSIAGVVLMAGGLAMWLSTWRRSSPPQPAPKSHEAPAG